MWQPSSSILVGHELDSNPAPSPWELECPYGTRVTNWWPFCSRAHSCSIATGLSSWRCGHGSDEHLACRAPHACKSLSSHLTQPLIFDLGLRAWKPREGKALSPVSAFLPWKETGSPFHSSLKESWSLLTHCCTQVGIFDSTNRKMLIWFSN